MVPFLASSIQFVPIAFCRLTKQLFEGVVWRRVSKRPHIGSTETERYVVMRQSTEAFGRISYPWVWSRCSHLENWCIIPLRPCIWQPFLAVWVLHVEHRTLDSSGDDFVCGRNAWFDSGYGVCDSTWLLDDFHTISTLPWTPILKRLVFILMQHREECSVDASVSVLDALLAPGNLEILSRVSRGWR